MIKKWSGALKMKRKGIFWHWGKTQGLQKAQSHFFLAPKHELSWAGYTLLSPVSFCMQIITSIVTAVLHKSDSGILRIKEFWEVSWRLLIGHDKGGIKPKFSINSFSGLARISLNQRNNKYIWNARSVGATFSFRKQFSFKKWDMTSCIKSF